MASPDWITRIRRKLEALGILPAEAPDPDEGNEHWRNLRDYFQFFLRPKVPVEQIVAFEKTAGAQLPDDYRLFLVEIGNGGYGPGEGLYPLGIKGEVIEAVGRPFPLTEPLRIDEEWLRTNDSPEARKHLSDGTLHLAHYGCGIQAVLIVCGERYGEVWIEDLANDGGVVPATPRKGGPQTRLSFSQWYEDWLDSQLEHWDITLS